VSAIPCRLLYQSTSPHLQQLYTGFLLLHQSGFIRLSQKARTKSDYGVDSPHLREAGHAHLDAVLGDVRVHFDTHDAVEIALPELDACDFYFKRSYSAALAAKLPAELRNKLRPLGLNYRVLPDGVDTFALRRSLSLNGLSSTTLGEWAQALDIHNRLRFRPRLAQMRAPPDITTAPRVLFLVSAYDPYDDPDRSAEKVEDRVLINESRARCIRLLRAALGDRFLGGFSRTRFTVERYGDLVVPSEATAQENYLLTLKAFPICVATTGLHGSIGWKFAEYVAFAKAIVSERLCYEVPGPFGADRNYLEFASPEQCTERVMQLVEDAGLRQELMCNNAEYYEACLRPDHLVRNALTEALQGQRPGVRRSDI
jgi:hypothetical protein